MWQRQRLRVTLRRRSAVEVVGMVVVANEAKSKTETGQRQRQRRTKEHQPCPLPHSCLDVPVDDAFCMALTDEAQNTACQAGHSPAWGRDRVGQELVLAQDLMGRLFDTRKHMQYRHSGFMRVQTLTVCTLHVRPPTHSCT